jgi:hypothetical protein
MKKIKLTVFIVLLSLLMIPFNSSMKSIPLAKAIDCLPGEQGYYFLEDCTTTTGQLSYMCVRSGTGCNVEIPCC